MEKKNKTPKQMEEEGETDSPWQLVKKIQQLWVLLCNSLLYKATDGNS